MNRIKMLISFVIASGLFGCVSAQPKPPTNNTIAVAIAGLYSHAGVQSPIVSKRVLGKHYSPALDQWSVVACVDFKFSDNESTDCNDSFTLISLDSGRWVLRGTVNGQYRWMEVVSAKS